MLDDLQLNVPLLRRRVPNLTSAARAIGLRAATVSNLCTGKIPVGRAEVRTLVALATLANCTLDELILRGGALGFIETGIKVVDLFCPVVRGGTVGFVSRPRLGQLVALAEILHRLNQRNFKTVFWSPEQDIPDMQDVGDVPQVTCFTKEEVRSVIAAVHGEQDVFLTVDRQMLLSGELLELREELREAGVRPITTALIDIRTESADEEAPFGPLDSLVKFDTDLAARCLWPAIDPVISTSVLLEGAQLEASHSLIAQRARKLLRRYRELRPLVQCGRVTLSESDQLVYNRGERLEAFLAQPFFVAEEFTKKSGEFVSLPDTLEDVRKVLDGVTDDMDVSQLRFIGRLP